MHEELKKNFLEKLAAAGGQGSMWDLGQGLGLDRAATEPLGLELMSEGLVEMASLSGGIRLTEAGREALSPPETGGHGGLKDLLKELANAGTLGLGSPAAGNLTVDVATLRSALERQDPLPQVVNALVKSLVHALEQAGDPRAAGLAELLREHL
ncbi:MAG: hypothetical protein KQJ78_04780 [Deltaproteobacteria bacterium]|nr:hypothetical protein [Deltaproteobacteria bacterium]